MATVPISNVTRRTVYAPSGAGGVGPYAFTFEILANTDIAVFKDDTLLTLTTHYTVTINGNGTGSVLINATGLALAPASPTQYAIVGNRTIARSTDFTTGGDFFANTLNDELDQQTIFAQQNAEGLNRALQAPQTDPTTINMTLPAKATRASKTLSFDANGDPTPGISAADVANAVTYATNAAASATAAAASAAAAASSASSATSSASTATTQATNASTSATTATTQASNASTSASSATASATTATTQANSATSSATSAATSATTATAQAAIALTQANGAAASAATATTQASSATASAATATTQAAAASTSATNAASSATAAAASAASGMYSAVQDKSANYTVVVGDAGDLLRVTTTSGNITITLPAISTVSDGFKVAIVKWTVDANTVTVARSGSDTINGATSATIGVQYSSITFVADYETNQWFAASTGLGVSNVNVDAFSGDGSTVAFTLSGDPASENNTQVYVSGVYQEKDTYSVSGTTLTFSTAPPSGTSNIEVVWTSPLAIGTPSDGTVTTAKLASTTGSGAVVLATSPTLVTPTLGAASATSITVAAGAVGTPSITTAGDTNTGIFFPAADTIAFAEGGAEAMRIDSSGNVGIGTASPSYKLDVRSSLAVLDGSSNIGFWANGTTYTQVWQTLQSVNDFVIQTAASKYIGFGINSTERMRINTSGQVILGSNTSTVASNVLNLWSPASTVNGIYMQKNGQVEVQMGFKASTNTDFYIGTGSTTMGTYGVYLANTGTSWISVSDERQKDIIEPIENALTKVNAIRAVIGKYKHDEDGVRRSFLIAQDVQAVFPEAVKIQNDEEALLGLSYTDVIPLLVAAIKEQQALITALTARITALEN